MTVTNNAKTKRFIISVYRGERYGVLRRHKTKIQVHITLTAPKELFKQAKKESKNFLKNHNWDLSGNCRSASVKPVGMPVGMMFTGSAVVVRGDKLLTGDMISITM